MFIIYQVHIPGNTLVVEPPPPQVSVIYDIPLKELRLFTDYGRTSRPLYIVHDQQLLIKRGHITKLGDESDNYNWQNLVVDGLVE